MMIRKRLTCRPQRIERAGAASTAVEMIAACVLALLAAAPLAAQPVHHLDEVHTPRTYDSLQEWRGRADSLRTHILLSTGLLPMPERTPLSPTLSEPLERDGYTVRNVVLETHPGFYLTGNLYRPTGQAGRMPAVLSAHGHWEAGRLQHGELASVPGRAAHLSRLGFVVFSYSMIGYNETSDVLPHRFDDPRHELWGFSAMGLQLWNSMRALDFLSGLDYVDPERIGMTGASGGGTQTFMLTAVDPRISASAPVNMISAHMQGGCVCENAPLLRLWATNIDIAALAAPRPLLMVSTSGDWTTNTPDVEYPAVRSVYQLFGAEDRVENVHLDYPHNYNRESREAVYAWITRRLQGALDVEAEEPHRSDDPNVLLAELPSAPRTIDELFEDHQGRVMDQIDQAKPDGWAAIYAYRDRFGSAFEHVFATGTVGTAATLRSAPPETRSGRSGAVLIVRADSLSEQEAAAARTRAFERERRMVFEMHPHPRPFAAPDTIEHATTYNATTTARRVDAIRRAAKQILARPDVASLDLVGLGEAGPWTLLARAMVPDVRNTEIDFNGFQADSDEAFVDDLFVPLLRRAGDFKTATVMTAPAPLEISGMPSGSLPQWIRDVYEAAGASEMLRLD